MATPDHPITLSPQEIETLSHKLSDFRHNVNNYLSLIVAASDLIRRRPEAAGRFADALADPPQKIAQELQAFSDSLQQLLEITPR